MSRHGEPCAIPPLQEVLTNRTVFEQASKTLIEQMVATIPLPEKYRNYFEDSDHVEEFVGWLEDRPLIRAIPLLSTLSRYTNVHIKGRMRSKVELYNANVLLNADVVGVKVNQVQLRLTTYANVSVWGFVEVKFDNISSELHHWQYKLETETALNVPGYNVVVPIKLRVCVELNPKLHTWTVEVDTYGCE